VKAPQPIIETRGAGKAAADLKQLGDRGSDVRRVADKVRKVYLRSNQRRFQTGGSGQWPSLKPSTVERKARQNLDPRPLRATGTLYRSLTSSRAADQVDQREATELRFGSTVPYAGYHDQGKGRMHRELIELTASERAQVSKAVSDYIAKAET
jgi:phage gpG-like protein